MDKVGWKFKPCQAGAHQNCTVGYYDKDKDDRDRHVKCTCRCHTQRDFWPGQAPPPPQGSLFATKGK